MSLLVGWLGPTQSRSPAVVSVEPARAPAFDMPIGLTRSTGRPRKPSAVAANHLRANENLRQLASAAAAPCQASHLAKRELTAVPAGEVVNVDDRELAAAAAFKARRDVQRHDFGKAVAIEIAMTEDASPSPVHA